MSEYQHPHVEVIGDWLYIVAHWQFGSEPPNVEADQALLHSSAWATLTLTAEKLGYVLIEPRGVLVSRWHESDDPHATWQAVVSVPPEQWAPLNPELPDDPFYG